MYIFQNENVKGEVNQNDVACDRTCANCNRQQNISKGYRVQLFRCIDNQLQIVIERSEYSNNEISEWLLHE